MARVSLAAHQRADSLPERALTEREKGVIAVVLVIGLPLSYAWAAALVNRSLGVFIPLILSAPWLIAFELARRWSVGKLSWSLPAAYWTATAFFALLDYQWFSIAVPQAFSLGLAWYGAAVLDRRRGYVPQWIEPLMPIRGRWLTYAVGGASLGLAVLILLAMAFGDPRPLGWKGLSSRAILFLFDY